MLKNGSYYSLYKEETITLVDGSWEKRVQDQVRGYVEVKHIAFGDLNNDGIEDAVLVFAENGGGTLWISSVHVVINRDGVPVESAYREVYSWSGAVKKLSIHQQQIILEEILHDWDDPNCCPSLQAVEIMQFLSDGHLAQRRFTSIAESGRREIVITSPAEGTAVSCSVHVEGSVTHHPLNNLLYYSIRNLADEELASGSFAVEIHGDNAGGVFDVSIGLGKVPAEEAVILYVYNVDYEHYDYLQALDSVYLAVR